MLLICILLCLFTSLLFMSEYKFDAFLEAGEQRLRRWLESNQNQQSDDDHQDERDNAKINDSKKLTTAIFSMDDFKSKHPSFKCKSFCNVTEEQLDYLIEVVEEKIGPKTRGKKPNISAKDQLFLTLTYFASYQTYEILSQLVELKVPTLQRIVKRIVNTYFPIFVKKFIPADLPRCLVEFDNFPEAVGAIDSTTIPFLLPSDLDERPKTFDAKNHVNGLKIQLLVNPRGIAIHVNADFYASTHDKKIFDLSQVTQFVTVKRGKQDIILPILADRGYIGIEKYHVTAIVQQRGDDDETKIRNNDIAHDRVIVENFIGRLKGYWGVLTEGYRGDRRYLKDIAIGLVALTNYLVDQSPLRSKSSENIKPPAEKEQKSTSNESESFKHTNEVIGIKNQGTTCHLISVLQVIYFIPELKAEIGELAKSQAQPCLELSSIFDVLTKKEQRFATTNKLTRVLGKQWLEAADCSESYEELLKLIKTNLEKHDSDNMANFEELLITNTQNAEETGQWYFLPVPYEENESDLQDTLPRYIQRYSSFSPSKVFSIVLQRASHVSYEYKYTFPAELDLSEFSSNDNKEFFLDMIIAYAGFHFSVFKKKNDEIWYYLNDQNCWEIESRLIPCLFGGDETNDLWSHTTPYKWIARMLIYKTTN